MYLNTNVVGTLIRAAETAQELEERKLQARYERELALHDAGYGEPAGAGEPHTRPPESSPEEEADDETTAGGEECPKRKTRLQELEEHVHDAVAIANTARRMGIQLRPGEELIDGIHADVQRSVTRQMQCTYELQWLEQEIEVYRQAAS